ncbi:MAG: hypothetical protein ABI672_02185 [Vicinamibacteria bacterium]
MKNLQTVSQVNGPHLIVEELADELVIFDRTTNKAHMLDPRAASIWRASAGGTTVDRLVGQTDGTKHESERSLVLLAILELQRAGLLLGDGERGAVSRRSLLKTIGVTTATPFVISILSPTSASAATTCTVSGGGDQLNMNTDVDGSDTGNCGNCVDMATAMQHCAGVSSVSMGSGNWPKLDGCACVVFVQCCSGMCNMGTCGP